MSGQPRAAGISETSRIKPAKRKPTASVTAAVAAPRIDANASQRRSQVLREAGAITSRVKMPTNNKAIAGNA